MRAMRLWSIHPKYLDRQGLIALWREGLLAQKVLAGKTRGYRFHPQLARFRESRNPLAYIGYYLHQVAIEAKRRQYQFDQSKIQKLGKHKAKLTVRAGQLKYEGKHLLKKLERRDPQLHKKWNKLTSFRAHPLFRSCRGGIEPWERII